MRKAAWSAASLMLGQRSPPVSWCWQAERWPRPLVRPSWLAAQGGLTGSVLARWLGDHHAAHLEQQIENGGLLLWVRAWNAEDEARAAQILARHSGEDVHSHGAFLAAA